jgi:hypothetical protein
MTKFHGSLCQAHAMRQLSWRATSVNTSEQSLRSARERQPRKRESMWELEDWKDLSKMLENFAEAALAFVGIFLVLKWLAKHKD